jgi:hypothetical protein
MGDRMLELQAARARLYVVFEGSRGDRRPVSARPRAPRSGIKVRVAVEAEAIRSLQIFLLFRRGDGDMVIGASASRELLEGMRARLGRSADAYEIAAVPVVRQRLAPRA